MKTLQKIRKVNGVVEERDKLLKWFSRYLDNMTDGETLIEFNPTDRTDAQNKYYWAIVRYLSNRIGIEADVLHSMFKDMFLPKEEYIVLIREKKIQSTTEQNKVEMNHYIDQVIQFAAESLEVVIPDIEEYKHQTI